MGCHTWCYAHIPSKKKEWEEEYANALKEEGEKFIEYWKSLPIERLDTMAREENEDNERYVSDFRDAKKNGDISEYLKYFESIDDLNQYIADCLVTITGEELRERQIKYISEGIRLFNEFKGSVAEFFNTYRYRTDIDIRPSKFGSFIVKDNIMYRDCSQKNVFPKQYHDIFRLYDYEAEPCYSYEETIERIKSYNERIKSYNLYGKKEIDLDEVGGIIKEFWETYPYAIISFG